MAFDVGHLKGAILMTKKSPKTMRKRSGSTKAIKSVGLPSTRAHSRTESTTWQHALIDKVRSLIEQADPDVIEEQKWRKPSNGMRGIPVWSREGLICTGETYKDKVKLTFARGAGLPDPTGLFNSSLDGNARRAIDLRERDKLDDTAFKTLIRAAVALNLSLNWERSKKTVARSTRIRKV